MVIAAAHFDLLVKEKTIRGYFTTGLEPKLDMPKIQGIFFLDKRDELVMLLMSSLF